MKKLPENGASVPLQGVAYFGWFIGLFPVSPSSISSFKILSFPFIRHCLFTCAVIIFVLVTQGMHVVQVIRTPYEFLTDKIAKCLRDGAATFLDIGLRISFLMRAGSFVELVQSIRQYQNKYSPSFRRYNINFFVKYGCFIYLNCSYIAWVTGMTWRVLVKSVSTQGFSWNILSMFPSEKHADKIPIVGALCSVFFILSSYYVILVVICFSHILLEFLADLKEGLVANLRAENAMMRVSDVDKVEEQEHGNQCSPLKAISHTQLTELRRLFRQFNDVIGQALLASLMADVLMITSLFYNFASKLATSQVVSKGLANADGLAPDLDLITASSEVEYEMRLLITAFIGSHIVNQVNCS